MEVLDIVNEADEVIGKETREIIYREGLLHRLIRVWFYTPKKEIIFQLRGKNKQNFPNLLDATVGGHVESGSDYVETAIKEIQEETGIEVKQEDLTAINTFRRHTINETAKTIINSINKTYIYYYSDKLENLKVEEADGGGFEVWPIERALQCSEEDKRRLTPIVQIPEIREAFLAIKKLTKIHKIKEDQSS